MIHRFLPPRQGITLIEVLAAIFIMGVGMLALFTLFPLGALSMARAVRDDRASAIAANAASLATAMDLRNDPNVAFLLSQGGSPTGRGAPVLVDPSFVSLALNGTNPPGSPGTFRWSFSLLGGAINRVAPQYAANSTDAARWFTFQEEMTFEKTGQVTTDPTRLRPGTYTWTYLLRRPRANDPALVEMSVIIYAGRAADVADPEPTFTGCVTTGPNSIDLPYPAGAKPNIRRGTWVMDTTVSGGTVNAFAYRVENVVDKDSTTLSLEVDPALKANVTSLVVLEKVIAVVDRSTTWKP